MTTIDKKDIQGFLLKGYGRMRTNRYYLLSIGDAALAKKWIGGICNHISDGEHPAHTTCLNFAISYPGLKALGVEDRNLVDFSREFKEGIDTAHRNRILGDAGESDPKEWEFGSNKDNASDMRYVDTNIHIMVMAFAKDDTLLGEYMRELEAGFAAARLDVLQSMDGSLLKENKIHMGFRDGISQPGIVGITTDAHPNNMVATGEFILGYKNEYGVLPDTPFINTPQGDMSLLPMDPGGSGKRDFGFNGSYLVYRKMVEQVDLFWKYVNDHTRDADGNLNTEESIKLASKMVGRWPNGSPITKYPDKMPEGMSDDDDFGYQPDDKLGLKCPFGSHMRRNNPRDAFEDNKPKLSLKLTKKHRILRRGRSYGEPLVSTPTDHIAQGEIGLHFICLNADIANQFEFIQHTWANFPRFQNLYNDPDPISGARDIALEGEPLTQNFTVQGEPVSKCFQDLQPFVTVKGGAYFFLPSMSAIKYLSTI